MAFDIQTTGSPDSFRWSGISLKSDHYQAILETAPPVAFLEVHAENYMVAGGAHHRYLEACASLWPISMHGVGMSLGSADGLDKAHLERFRALADKYSPFLVSEHLAWSSSQGAYLNDLLPVPLTEESLQIVSDNISHFQDFIGQKVLIENPSSYMSFDHTTFREADYLMELVARTGCGLLLDINNIFVSASNLGLDPGNWLSTIDPDVVGEVHLAGHTVRDVDGVMVRIDDHGSRVSEEVRTLFAAWLDKAGPTPTLVEWDSNIPALEVLVEEARLAEDLLAVCVCEREQGHD